jgi:hypothetical protein
MTEQQLGVLAGLLAEIRDRLSYLCEPLEQDETTPACEHPEERRTDFSSPREIHWVCGDCDHVERQDRTTRAPALPPSASAEE